MYFCKLSTNEHTHRHGFAELAKLTLTEGRKSVGTGARRELFAWSVNQMA